MLKQNSSLVDAWVKVPWIAKALNRWMKTIVYNYINSYLNLTYFYLDVSISIRDLRQKKFVQFFWKNEQASSDEEDRNVKVRICQVEIWIDVIINVLPT